MANKVKTVITFRRGTLDEWLAVDPVLREGEPQYVLGTSLFKIGNGFDKWSDLEFVGEESVVNAATHYDFPSIGRVNVIYKAEKEKKIYQWNSETMAYEVLNESQDDQTGVSDITLIHGGNANGDS